MFFSAVVRIGNLLINAYSSEWGKVKKKLEFQDDRHPWALPRLANSICMSFCSGPEIPVSVYLHVWHHIYHTGDTNLDSLHECVSRG